MTTYLIAAIDESTGKTAVALALAVIGRDRGHSVGYMKPKGTRIERVANSTHDSDAVFARDFLSLSAEIDTLEPLVYSQTFINEIIRGNKDPAAISIMVRDRFSSLEQPTDLMVVEGGTTYSSGGVIELTDPDLAELLDAQVILVASYQRPSDVDEVLAATDHFGVRLAGVIFNGVRNGVITELTDHTVPFLEHRGIQVTGVLPRVTELAGATVADFAVAIGGELLTSSPADSFVERLLVGAMGADASLRYFRRANNAVVITGGDRSDIHSIALEAPGVNCLCLTGGYRPSSAVVGKAERKGVPIVLVPTDTLTTIERAERVLRSGRVRDVETVNRMQSLLLSRVNVDALFKTI